MNCKLCEKEIIKFNPSFNTLIIDENHSANICLECIDKFFKWQGKVYSILFPTSALKKKFSDK